MAVKQLPDHVWEAFLAIEDRRFYDHSGIDPWGLLRAVFSNLRAGGLREGGSTITQQLAKQSFLSSDRTFGRKAQEGILAFWIEAQLSKDQILSRYLSTVYFGDNVYGLRAASRHYFDSSPEQLTVSEAAMLAGLVKAPSRLAPTKNLSGARERADVVVGAMVDAGILEEASAQDLRPAKLRSGERETLPGGTYFTDWLFSEAPELEEAEFGERTVRTTLDDRLQKLADRAVRQAPSGAQVALVASRAASLKLRQAGSTPSQAHKRAWTRRRFFQ